MPTQASKRRTASVIPLENGIQVKGIGMDLGFHRGDDKAGMTERKNRFSVDVSAILGF
jgi:hypothetical protein